MAAIIKTSNWLARNELQTAVAQAVKRMEHEIEVCSGLIASGKHTDGAASHFSQQMNAAREAAAELRAVKIVFVEKKP